MSPGDGEDVDEHLDRVLIGGLEELHVRLADYSEAWPQRFEAERCWIEASLGPTARRVEHIGPTAVPGLAAKPIVDIMVTVDDPEPRDVAGLVVEPGGPERVPADQAPACRMVAGHELLRTGQGGHHRAHHAARRGLRAPIRMRATGSVATYVVRALFPRSRFDPAVVGPSTTPDGMGVGSNR